jgi:hypothetical protein
MVRCCLATRCSLLGPRQSAPRVRHASPDGISGDRSTVPAVVWVTKGAASHGLIIRLIIQTILLDPSGSFWILLDPSGSFWILLDPSGAVWTDEAPNVSRLDPSGADQADAEHPTRNRKVVDLLPGLPRSTGFAPTWFPCRNSSRSASRTGLYQRVAGLAGLRNRRTSSWAMIRNGSPRARALRTRSS